MHPNNHHRYGRTTHTTHHAKTTTQRLWLLRISGSRGRLLLAGCEGADGGPRPGLERTGLATASPTGCEDARLRGWLLP